MGHSAVTPKSHILKDGQMFMTAAQVPCKPPDALGKSTSIEFTYDKYTVFAESGTNSLCLSAALASCSLIAVHDAHRFSLTHGSPQAAGDPHTNSLTLSASSAGSYCSQAVGAPNKRLNLAPEWCYPAALFSNSHLNQL